MRFFLRCYTAVIVALSLVLCGSLCCVSILTVGVVYLTVNGTRFREYIILLYDEKILMILGEKVENGCFSVSNEFIQRFFVSGTDSMMSISDVL